MDGINLLKYWFYPLLERAGLPRMCFHDLRHIPATLLLGRSINPKVVSEMLGHSHVSVTLGIYSHLMPHMQQQAASAMDEALRKGLETGEGRETAG
jgi:integrase